MIGNGTVRGSKSRRGRSTFGAVELELELGRRVRPSLVERPENGVRRVLG